MKHGEPNRPGTICAETHYLRFFFFNDTATTEIYTLSLHDALPISTPRLPIAICRKNSVALGDWSGLSLSTCRRMTLVSRKDRKSTRLNSSHANISYAVFCLKKKLACRVPLAAAAAGALDHGTPPVL